MLAALLLAALLPAAALAQGFPNPTGLVNDFANVLSPQARQGLEQTLRQIQQDTTAEVVVVTAPSLGGTTADDYAVRLFEQWKIGKKGKDNGVLLLVAPNEREVRIEVGYGLEPVITDARASQIIRNQVLPRFREGDYDGGVTAAVASLEGYVRSGAPPTPLNDFANVLSPQARQGLEQTLRQIEQDTTAEVVVVTVPSLGGTTVDDYAVRLFEQWKIGKKGKDNKDNGVLLLVAPNKRDVRIEVGHDLEPVITDARASQIIRNQIAPRFREGDYDGGVTAAVKSLEGYVRSGAPPAPLEENPVKSGLGDWLWLFWPIALVTVYMAGFMARSKTVWLGTIWGGAVGALVGLLIGGILALGLAVVATALLGAAFDWVLTKTYKTQVQSGRRTDFLGSRGGFRGGPWMGGGFGGGGGGGFGWFGGGGSGGGGASGKW